MNEYDEDTQFQNTFQRRGQNKVSYLHSKHYTHCDMLYGGPRWMNVYVYYIKQDITQSKQEIYKKLTKKQNEGTKLEKT